MVLEPNPDPIDEPRDSSGRTEVPDSECVAQPGPDGPVDTSNHEDLRRAAESALRIGKAWGELAEKVVDRKVVPPTRRIMKVGARTVKSVAKWVLI